jgi:hypothetical protein
MYIVIFSLKGNILPEYKIQVQVEKNQKPPWSISRFYVSRSHGKHVGKHLTELYVLWLPWQSINKIVLAKSYTQNWSGTKTIFF